VNNPPPLTCGICGQNIALEECKVDEREWLCMIVAYIGKMNNDKDAEGKDR
jgi:hypothetical protein